MPDWYRFLEGCAKKITNVINEQKLARLLAEPSAVAGNSTRPATLFLDNLFFQSRLWHNAFLKNCPPRTKGGVAHLAGMKPRLCVRCQGKVGS
jgi:hypothetical protein